MTSNGSIVTGTLTNADNILDNLTLVLPDFVTFDTTTTPSTITLTAGTDSNTQTNYVYIPEDTKALTVSTTGYPTDKNHCRIATLEVQSAATVQSDGGARGNQNWNDHFKKVNGNGHANHVTAWIREQFAKAKKSDGCSVTLDSTGGNGYLTVASGLITQLHKQSISEMVMPTLNCLIHNDPDTTYRATNNLNTITKFSDGANWNNEWGKIVVWISANKGGEPNYIYVNLPRDGYNTELKAFEDEKSRANYEIDDKLISKAALVGEFVINISSGSITYNGTSTGFKDLRGTIPSNTSSGGAGGVTSLLALDDVSPSSFSGQAGKSLTVASGETTTEFVEHLKTDGTSTMAGDLNMGTNNNILNAIIKNDGVVNMYLRKSTGTNSATISNDPSNSEAFTIKNLLSDEFVVDGQLTQTACKLILKYATSGENYILSNSIGIETNAPLKLDSTLDVYGEVDLHNQNLINAESGEFGSVLGVAKIGVNKYGLAGFAHADYIDTDDYGFSQSTGGNCGISYATGQSLDIRENNNTAKRVLIQAGNISATGVTTEVVAEYADNAAAVTAGLSVGTHYRTGDILKIVH
ncbi:MAG: hypothetical protein GY928_40285 [Colwellia sp.]|nr:hypothetical protein [Colwellia sp.]